MNVPSNSNGVRATHGNVEKISYVPNGASKGTSRRSERCNETRNGSSQVSGALHVTMSKPSTTCPIALVGMSCKFGGEAASAPKFRDLCVDGKDVWSPIP